MMSIGPEKSQDRAKVVRFPSRQPVRIDADAMMAVIPIGDGSLAYRVNDNGACLCRAIGDEAVAASTLLFGPPTGASSEGHSVWELQQQHPS